MRTAPPPDNLPIEPPSESPGVVDLYGITSDDVVRLRAALAEDLGYDGHWSDAEIRSMARTTLDFVRTVIRIGDAQRRRGIRS